MERSQIIEAMTSLKLSGMRASFDEIAGKGGACQGSDMRSMLNGRRRAGSARGTFNAKRADIQCDLTHTKLESTVRYLGMEVDDAIAIAEQVDI
jgi:hypothetical protein